MNSNIFTLNWKNLIGAIVSAALVAVITYIIDNPNSIALLTNHPILSTGVLAGAASLLKALLTDSSGNLAGVLPVK